MLEREVPIKVAFVGTSCVGKTTLLEEYRRRFGGDSSVAIVDEAVRQGFHNAFLSFFEESGIPFELLSGSLEKRITRIDEILAEEKNL